MKSEREKFETVLAVDHDTNNLGVLKSILSLKGLDVLEATDGNEALDLATRWHPELILMDLKLPLVSGFTVVRRLKNLPTLRDVPIISFAVNKPTCHRKLALAAGCSAHLDKPIDFEELEYLIDQFLPGHILQLSSALVH